MAKKVTKYQAEDGRVFDTEGEAIAHETHGFISDLFKEDYGPCMDRDDIVHWWTSNFALEPRSDFMKSKFAGRVKP